MTRQQAGHKLNSLLQLHERAETEALAALPEGAAFEETSAAIETASQLEAEGLSLQVQRRRSLTFCPVPDCRYARRQICPFSNTRYEISNPSTGQSATGPGLLWHLLAEHEPKPSYAAEEQALLALFRSSKEG